MSSSHGADSKSFNRSISNKFNRDRDRFYVWKTRSNQMTIFNRHASRENDECARFYYSN